MRRPNAATKRQVTARQVIGTTYSKSNLYEKDVRLLLQASLRTRTEQVVSKAVGREYSSINVHGELG
jgi:hypothetical protein